VETRIKRNIIILVVLTFLILVGMSAGWFFVLVRPQKEEIAKVDTEYNNLKAKAAKLSGSLEEEQKAKDKLQYLEGQLNFFRGSMTSETTPGLYRRLYFGEIDGTTPLNIAARQKAWRMWMNEYHYAYGPALEAELRRINGLTNAKFPLPAIKVEDPPQKPEDVKPPANGFMKPVSAALTLNVTGEFVEILKLLEAINHSSIFMVVGNIKLTGTSPSISATFPVTPYLLAAGPGIKGAPAAAPPAAATATPPAEGAPAAGEEKAKEGEEKAKDKAAASIKAGNPQFGF